MRTGGGPPDYAHGEFFGVDGRILGRGSALFSVLALDGMGELQGVREVPRAE